MIESEPQCLLRGRIAVDLDGAAPPAACPGCRVLRDHAAPAEALCNLESFPRLASGVQILGVAPRHGDRAFETHDLPGAGFPAPFGYEPKVHSVERRLESDLDLSLFDLHLDQLQPNRALAQRHQAQCAQAEDAQFGCFQAGSAEQCALPQIECHAMRQHIARVMHQRPAGQQDAATLTTSRVMTSFTLHLPAVRFDVAPGEIAVRRRALASIEGSGSVPISQRRNISP